tara:strand:+ start:943 stop:1122 length:180 start_codon:yes stop_codon:yes gene_type:complete
MKVKELIKILQVCNQESEVNTFNHNSDDPTNFWVIDVEESRIGSSGYEEEGEVRLITSE